MLERTKEQNLKLNKGKSQIEHTEISYIGHILSKDGVKPDPKKVDAIIRMELPKDKAELQRFLGMATYLFKFIPNISQTASPLRSLLQKDVDWHWEDQQQRSLQKLKQAIAEAATLKYFDPKKLVKVCRCQLKRNWCCPPTRREPHHICFKSIDKQLTKLRTD